jgi:ABC-type transporter Mla MlaB component
MSFGGRSGLYITKPLKGDLLAAPKESALKCVRATRPASEPNTLVLIFSGLIDRAEIPAICNQAGSWLSECDTKRVVCDVRAVVDPDAVTIDALARLRLTAKRMGLKVTIRHASHQLRDLLRFTGLEGAVPISDS